MSAEVDLYVPADGAHSDILQKLEDFFSDPALTSSISDFASSHAAEIVPLALDAEHPLRYHELYLQYTAMIEQRLEAFLVEESSSVEQLVNLVASTPPDERVKFTCIDYLIASTEYAKFLELMFDFGSLREVVAIG